MNFTTDTIYVIKVSTGEEIIGKIVEVLDLAIMVSQPVLMMPTQQGLQMIPALMSANTDQPVTISRSAIVMISVPREDIESAYIQATTGLAVPNAKKIITG